MNFIQHQETESETTPIIGEVTAAQQPSHIDLTAHVIHYGVGTIKDRGALSPYQRVLAQVLQVACDISGQEAFDFGHQRLSRKEVRAMGHRGVGFSIKDHNLESRSYGQEIANVIVVRPQSNQLDRRVLVPIVFPSDSSELGVEIRKRINAAFHHQHGIFPYEAILTKTDKHLPKQIMQVAALSAAALAVFCISHRTVHEVHEVDEAGITIAESVNFPVARISYSGLASGIDTQTLNVMDDAIKLIK